MAAGPTRGAAVLIGGAVAMVISGLANRFGDLFSASTTPSPLITGGVTGTAMIALAVGIRMPQRIAVWVCTNAWRRVVSRERPIPMGDIPLGNVETDRPLYWTVLSVIALGAGLLIALFPVNFHIATASYAWMRATFLWPVGPLALLQAVIVFLCGLIPLAMLGLAISCVHHLSCPHCRWDTSATAWLLLGAGVGTLASAALIRAAAPVELLLIAGALPALILSLTAALSCTQRPTRANETGSPSPQPFSTVRRPRLVRAGIVAVGSTGACIMSVCLSGWRGSIGQQELFAALMLFAAGIGALIGCARPHTASQSIGGFGMACLAAALVVTLPAIAIAGAASQPGLLWILTACAAMSTVGGATTYGRKALLHRVASRSSTGATMLARTFVYVGMTVWILAPTALRLTGKPTTLLMPALLLTVLGIALRTRDPMAVDPADS